MSHASRSVSKKYRAAQRRLASLAPQLPEFPQGRWVRPGPPELRAPGVDHIAPDVLIAVRAPAPRAGRGSWNR